MRISLDQNIYKDSSNGCGFCTTKHPNLDEFFGDFAKESTPHGIKYIGSKKLHPVERLFWTIVMLMSLGGGIYMVLRVYAKYDASPVMISFQPEETAVSQIPFPAITICSVNMLKTNFITKLFDGLNDTYIKLQEGDKSYVQAFLEKSAHLDTLGQFCLQTTSFRRDINETLHDVNGRKDFMDIVNEFMQTFTANGTEQLLKLHKDPNWSKEEMDIFKNATISCEELLLKCMWAEDLIPCKDIFFPIETTDGHCCVFNMMPQFILQKISLNEGRAKKEVEGIPERTILEWEEFGTRDLITNNKDDVGKIKYPKYQMAGGKPYGLTVLANPGLNEYSTCTTNDGWGYKMVAHSPVSHPSISEFGAAVPPGSEVFVEIEPSITVANETVLQDIPIEKRGCYLPTDPNSKLAFFNYYSVENCFAECISNHTYQRCSCVRFFMPRNSSQELCGAKKRQCADNVLSNLTQSFGKSSYCGHCFPPCTDIVYKLQMSHFDIRATNASSTFAYFKEDGSAENAIDYTIIHIFMGTDSIYAKERKKLYDTSALIANAGGLISLTLGLSIISFIEIGYYFTLGAWFKFWSVLKHKENKNGQFGRDMSDSRNINNKRSSVTVVSTNTEGYYNWDVSKRFSISGAAGRVKKRNVVAHGKPTIMF